jgi:signal transduction histidine kinase
LDNALEATSDVTQRIATDVQRMRESLHSEPGSPGEDRLSREVKNKREKAGGLVRLVGSTAFLIWMLCFIPTRTALWVAMLAFVLWSATALILILKDVLPRVRRWILVVTDVSLLSFLIYGLGAQTTPVTLLYVFVLLAWAARRGRAPGLVFLVLSITMYGAVLLLEEIGAIPRAPFVSHDIPPHTVPGGAPSAFFLTAAALCFCYFYASFFAMKMGEQNRTEVQLRASREAARAREATLWQRLEEVQRLEALGRLAGGIAHDFNNLLTGILGYVRFARERIEPDHPVQADLDEALRGAERASELTSQLLAFSRKQIRQPRVIDLNQLIEELGRLLSRILGEDVTLDIRPSDVPSLIRADPGQIERVVVNLAVNARDAMPGGGTLVLETAAVTLDPTYSADLVGLKAGPYVRLGVSDDGVGIDPAIISKIFEPFFTTKEQGKGTGLGLSTVYGIITQNGGNILVTSELGKGTTFTIYLPRVEGAPEPLESPLPVPSSGTETILLVEDEAMVRRVTARLLRSQGYTVIEATNGEEALRVVEAHEDRIHLLLSDVIMPEMTGPALAHRLRARKPDIRVLYMSGYAENELAHEGLIDGETELIEKPFSHEDLFARVRITLDKA